MTRHSSFQFRPLALRALVPFVVLLGLGLACGGREQMLVVLHTNDMHAWFAPRKGVLDDTTQVDLGGAPVLAALVRRYREENPGATLYLDGGDFFQGTPISTLSEGLACVEVMNLLAPDAVSLGNHEFDYGMVAQRRALDHAVFPVLQANVRMIGRPHPYAQSDLVVRRGNLQVAILGLNTDELFSVTDPRLLNGVRVDSSHAVARKWLKRVQSADVKICLSHGGFRADSLLALAVEGIDYIVGAHSHTVLHKPVQVGKTWIVQAGDQGRWLGVDTLYVKPGRGIRRAGGGLVPITAKAAPAAEDVAALVKAQEEQVNSRLGGVVATLATPFMRTRRGESAVGNWLCAAIRLETGAEIALWNNGGIRRDLLAGPLKERDFWELSPFGNEVVVAPVKGSRLRALLSQEAGRGGAHMHFDGLRVAAGPDGLPGVMLVGGKPMEESRSYRVAMTDYVWGLVKEEGDSLTVPVGSGVVDRDMLMARARKEKTIRAVVDGRWGPGEARGR
jgi:2',3'-cyclic-nucleotide 2'-phosphodiesterase (5'-nucleotidase family)